MTSGQAGFLLSHPGYRSTALLDRLRATEYSYLDAGGHVYLDYTGAGLPAQAQLNAHTERMHGRCFGNPHSENPTSTASTELIERARLAVLAYFNAPPDEYAAIFTPNAGRQYPRSRRHRRIQPAGSRRARRRRARCGASYRCCRYLDPYWMLLQPGRRRGRVPTHQGRLAQSGAGTRPHAGSVHGPSRPAERRGAPRIRGPGIERRRRGAIPRIRGDDLHGIAWSTLAASHPGRAVKPLRASDHAMRMGRHREEVSWGLVLVNGMYCARRDGSFRDG